MEAERDAFRETGGNAKEKTRWHVVECRHLCLKEKKRGEKVFCFLGKCLNVLLSHISLKGQKLFNSVAKSHRFKDEERVVERDSFTSFQSFDERIDICTTKSRTAYTAQNGTSEMHINANTHANSFAHRKIARTVTHMHTQSEYVNRP